MPVIFGVAEYDQAQVYEACFMPVIFGVAEYDQPQVYEACFMPVISGIEKRGLKKPL